MQEKVVENKSCKKCNAGFDIIDKDIEFYKKVSPTFGGEKFLLPSPILCPECRRQRRLSFLNQTKLYNNICGLCKQDIISRFHPESGCINYCNECWAGDNWDKLEFAKDIDFNKTMFSQFHKLMYQTPFQSLIGSLSNIKNNSEYTNHTSEINDSYLVFEANNINRSYYSGYIKNSNDIMDSCFVGNSEYTYENIDSYNMYQTYFCKNSFNCNNSYFLDNCYNCNNCFGCTNLVNKEYYVWNTQVDKETFLSLKKGMGSYHFVTECIEKLQKLSEKRICKSAHIIGSENSSGNLIINSKDCHLSFDVLECNNCKYCSSINYSEDLYDVSSYGEKSYLMYDSVSVGRFSHNILFCLNIGKGENLTYCVDVKKSKNCFLCVNLKEAEYCILNKQYTKEEYDSLIPKIIECMKNNGEWGNFFDPSISVFGYNESLADEYYPLSKNDAIKSGFYWSDYESPFPKVEKTIPAEKLPDSIKDIPDDILNWALICIETHKPFRIGKGELEFYRKHNLPIPRLHNDQRHLKRMMSRNPRELFHRLCDKCGIDMETSYSQERSETVYCEKCYDKEIY